MKNGWEKHEEKEEINLLKKVAKFYANGMYDLEDKITDEEIMRVSEITQDPKKEEYFNNLINVIKALREK